MSETLFRLLAEDEPAPFTVSNEGGRSPFFIVCDHAGTEIEAIRTQLAGIR